MIYLTIELSDGRQVWVDEPVMIDPEDKEEIYKIVSEVAMSLSVLPTTLRFSVKNATN